MRGKNRHERITLLDTHLRADKPYPHVDWESQHDELDYVDLGDNEAHPLVRAMHNMESKVYYPGSHHWVHTKNKWCVIHLNDFVTGGGW